MPGSSRLCMTCSSVLFFFFANALMMKSLKIGSSRGGKFCGNCSSVLQSNHCPISILGLASPVAIPCDIKASLHHARLTASNDGVDFQHLKFNSSYDFASCHAHPLVEDYELSCVGSHK